MIAGYAKSGKSVIFTGLLKSPKVFQVYETKLKITEELLFLKILLRIWETSKNRMFDSSDFERLGFKIIGPKPNAFCFGFLGLNARKQKVFGRILGTFLS